MPLSLEKKVYCLEKKVILLCKMTGTNGGRVSPRDFIRDKNSDQSAEFAGEIQDDRNKRVPKISYITIDFQSIVWRRK
jgi:hypothetical protein